VVTIHIINAAKPAQNADIQIQRSENTAG
jgi:hypothetical protein